METVRAQVMNALAHMCIGLGAKIGEEDLRLTNYQDADGGSHPFISEIPFIILCENSNIIRKLRNEAIANNILFNDFTDTMTVGTYEIGLIKPSNYDKLMNIFNVSMVILSEL